MPSRTIGDWRQIRLIKDFAVWIHTGSWNYSLAKTSDRSPLTLRLTFNKRWTDPVDVISNNCRNTVTFSWSGIQLYLKLWFRVPLESHSVTFRAWNKWLDALGVILDSNRFSFTTRVNALSNRHPEYAVEFAVIMVFVELQNALEVNFDVSVGRAGSACSIRAIRGTFYVLLWQAATVS